MIHKQFEIMNKSTMGMNPSALATGVGESARSGRFRHNLLAINLTSALAIAAVSNAAFGAESAPAKSDMKVSGVWQFEAARTTAEPEHTSKLKNSVDLNLAGKFSDNVKWKLGGRLSYDAVFDVNNFYPAAVEDDQRTEALALENYLDISQGDWDFRLGRQHIVWGEVVGLFFADVVSAKDMREFVLPEFNRLRIPQWATRAEYSKEDFHAEVIWIPYMTYDNIGKPGGEFYPYPPAAAGLGYAINNEVIPKKDASNSAYGLRLSYLWEGWDMAAFIYRSVDAAPVFSREILPTPTPTLVYTPEHRKIRQAGVTLAKDLGEMVAKAEIIYTGDREYTVTRLADSDGLVKQNTVDYVFGVEIPLFEDSRLVTQLFGRHVFHHDTDTLFDKDENGVILSWSTKFDAWEPQILVLSSVNRTDWLAQPRVTWNFARNWQAAFGADIFGGEPTGYFGRFDDKDRVYTEMRYTF
ncbi:MAG TPA: DUF1302 family protein [Burkholderiales bacterium]|nr:DUF1302 family protein [Burkholderiales bacterium]